VSMLGNDTAIVTGNRRAKFREALGSSRSPEIRFAPDTAAACNASSVGRIGERMLRMGISSDPVTLEPLYIKNFHSTAGKTTG
jgi:hypothetical protein